MAKSKQLSSKSMKMAGTKSKDDEMLGGPSNKAGAAPYKKKGKG